MTPDTPTERESAGAVLAVDYGEKRIGLAISDEGRLIATPMRGIPNKGFKRLVEQLGAIVAQREVARILVGLPINMDDTLGPQALEAQKLADDLEKRLDVAAVETFDERLSTVQALWVAQEVGLTKKKRRKRVDSMAAQAFLQTWLDLIRRDEPTTG